MIMKYSTNDYEILRSYDIWAIEEKKQIYCVELLKNTRAHQSNVRMLFKEKIQM